MHGFLLQMYVLLLYDGNAAEDFCAPLPLPVLSPSLRQSSNFPSANHACPRLRRKCCSVGRISEVVTHGDRLCKSFSNR
jgi:hypothetical protein